MRLREFIESKNQTSEKEDRGFGSDNSNVLKLEKCNTADQTLDYSTVQVNTVAANRCNWSVWPVAAWCRVPKACSEHTHTKHWSKHTLLAEPSFSVLVFVTGECSCVHWGIFMTAVCLSRVCMCVCVRVSKFLCVCVCLAMIKLWTLCKQTRKSRMRRPQSSRFLSYSRITGQNKLFVKR